MIVTFDTVRSQHRQIFHSTVCFSGWSIMTLLILAFSICKIEAFKLYVRMFVFTFFGAFCWCTLARVIALIYHRCLLDEWLTRLNIIQSALSNVPQLEFALLSPIRWLLIRCDLCLLCILINDTINRICRFVVWMVMCWAAGSIKEAWFKHSLLRSGCVWFMCVDLHICPLTSINSAALVVRVAVYRAVHLLPSNVALLSVHPVRHTASQLKRK